MKSDLIELCSLDIELYKCVTAQIATSRVVLTEKSDIHISEHHPDSYTQVMIDLKDTILYPDYIFQDQKHNDTALVVKKIISSNTFVVLRLCTNTQDGKLANSIISGWEISDARLRNYLRNKPILYKKS